MTRLRRYALPGGPDIFFSQGPEFVAGTTLRNSSGFRYFVNLRC